MIGASVIPPAVPEIPTGFALGMADLGVPSKTDKHYILYLISYI